METAFKLTQRSEPHFRNRAYQWLDTIVETAPLDFWNDRKKRVIKSIYTHAVDVVRADILPNEDGSLAKPVLLPPSKEPHKGLALRIALNFMTIVKHREFEEYEQAIRSNMLMLLAEDRRDLFRKIIVEKLDFGKDAESLAFLARKT